MPNNSASFAPRPQLLDEPCSRCLQHTNEPVLNADANTLKGDISVSFSWTSPTNTFFVSTSRCWTVLPLLQYTDSPERSARIYFRLCRTDQVTRVLNVHVKHSEP